MAEDTAAKLKHLAFVQGVIKGVASSVAAIELDKYYEAVKSRAPRAIGPYVSKVEDSVLAYGAPALAAASDTAGKFLRTADEQVDAVYLASAKWLSLEPLRNLHSSNMATYKAATDKYFTLIASTTDWAASKLSVDKNVQYAKEVLQSGLDKAKDADPDVAVKAAYQAWEKFATVPAVAKLLDATTPLTSKGVEAFSVLHDKLVASLLYKRSVSFGASTVQWAYTTTPYKLLAQYLYPYVRPVADPALDKLYKSVYVNKAVQYWQPAAQAV